MVYLLTSSRHRQVWNAVIASKGSRKVLESNVKEVVALRQDLLEQKASVLLKSAFNGLPSSFEALLSRFGSEAQDRDVFHHNLFLTVSASAFLSVVWTSNRLASDLKTVLAYLFRKQYAVNVSFLLMERECHCLTAQTPRQLEG
jgi:hypothetical protein